MTRVRLLAARQATATSPQLCCKYTVGTGEQTTTNARYYLHFEDDVVCRRSQQVTKQLLLSAAGNSTSTNSRLAKKALQYRKVYDRMHGVDVTTPEFDAASFLGVAWCKTTDLKAHCQRRQVTHITCAL